MRQGWCGEVGGEEIFEPRSLQRVTNEGGTPPVLEERSALPAPSIWREEGFDPETLGSRGSNDQERQSRRSWGIPDAPPIGERAAWDVAAASADLRFLAVHRNRVTALPTATQRLRSEWIAFLKGRRGRLHLDTPAAKFAALGRIRFGVRGVRGLEHCRFLAGSLIGGDSCGAVEGRDARRDDRRDYRQGGRE